MEGATDRARFAYLYTRAAVGNYTGVVDRQDREH